jgi:hypothetical protein
VEVSSGTEAHPLLEDITKQRSEARDLLEDVTKQRSEDRD